MPELCLLPIPVYPASMAIRVNVRVIAHIAPYVAGTAKSVVSIASIKAHVDKACLKPAYHRSSILTGSSHGQSEEALGNNAAGKR